MSHAGSEQPCGVEPVADAIVACAPGAAPAWMTAPAAVPDEAARAAAATRQTALTKPAGALGRLEEIAVSLAALQGAACPRVDRVAIVVFAADHGVAVEGVSAYPQSVSAQMVQNFARGGAAICVAARALGAQFEVVDLGTVGAAAPPAGVLCLALGAGTANFTQAAAMSPAQLAAALEAGRAAALRAHAAGAELFIGGEMGIGNTTAATALAAALMAAPAARLAGPGTGLDARGVAHKVAVIERALALHGTALTTPLETLRRLGGFEIAALVGSALTCAQLGLPVLVDGYIGSVAALIAVRLRADVAPWLLASHRSAEPGHALVLEALHARPLIDLGLRLGEGSGAAITVPLLRMACALHAGMATFTEAAVASRIEPAP